MQKLLTTLMALYCCGWAAAQNATLRVLPVWNTQVIRPNVYYISTKGDSVALDHIRFYITDLEVENMEGQRFKASQKAYLIDAFDTVTCAIPIVASGKWCKLYFNLGVDSLTNASGAQGGALDPAEGMYWTWQSGYINIKIEGNSPQSPHRKHKFMFHLGGYMPPFYGLRRIELPLKRGTTEGVTIGFDVEVLFNALKMKLQPNIMQPGPIAMAMADTLQHAFKVWIDDK